MDSKLVFVHKKNFKKNIVNKDHNNKEVNTTSLVKYFKPLFYACKHKYKTKTNKIKISSRPQGSTFRSENIPRTTIIFFCFSLESFASHQLTIISKLKKFLC